MERLLIPGHKFVDPCSCNKNCWFCQIRNAFANVSIIHAKTCFIKPVTNWRLIGSLFVMLVFRFDDYDAPQNWPCILKMKKFLSICVNAKTALWRQDRQNSAATSNLAAIHKRKIFENWNESKVRDRNFSDIILVPFHFKTSPWMPKALQTQHQAKGRVQIIKMEI